MKKEQNAFLIKEDSIDGTLAYFDFEAMCFSDKQPKKSVAVSTIDAMTTMFESSDELIDFLGDNQSSENKCFNYYIESRVKPKDKPKTYQVIWDDVSLSALSKVTDGNVDFTGNKQYEIILDIMNEIAKEDSGYTLHMVKAISDDLKLNSQSKSLLLAHNSDTSVDLTGEFIKNFSNYMQCRALYLGYKEYLNSKKKAVIKITKWKH